MLKIHFLVPYCTDTVGVKSPGLKKTFFKLSDTLLDNTAQATNTTHTIQQGVELQCIAITRCESLVQLQDVKL